MEFTELNYKKEPSIGDLVCSVLKDDKFFEDRDPVYYVKEVIVGNLEEIKTNSKGKEYRINGITISREAKNTVGINPSTIEITNLHGTEGTFDTCHLISEDFLKEIADNHLITYEGKEKLGIKIHKYHSITAPGIEEVFIKE
jgi:hypothetical protein